MRSVFLSPSSSTSSARRSSRGFSLIELLVVISIVALLSSVALASISGARAKGRDGKKRTDFASVSLALQLFYDVYQRMPANYNLGRGACEGDGFYEQSMNELVTTGFLPAIPRSPGGGTYCYYNYGAANAIGAIVVTTLETFPASTAGISPSCRPWAAGTNWCSQSSNTYYCICNPY